MKNIKRIVIIGNSGSGKSTLAQILGKVLNLPIYHLDQYYWMPNWTRKNQDEYKKIHDDLCNLDEWIIEGNNLTVAEYRLLKSDMIIFLDVPIYKCLFRILKRTITCYGKEVTGGSIGCKEEVSCRYIEFLKWVYNFNSRNRGLILNLLDKYKNDKLIIVLKSERDIANFIQHLN